MIYTEANLRLDLDLKSTTMILLLMLLTVLPTTLTSAPSNAPAKSNIQLNKSEFIVFDKKTSRRSPSTFIDYSKHSGYGWRIEFEAPKGKHTVTEVIKLPAPANWGVGANTVVSTNQMMATTKTEVVSHTTKFSAENYWSYAPGDPTGIYTFELYIDNKLIKTYVINVTN